MHKVSKMECSLDNLTQKINSYTLKLDNLWGDVNYTSAQLHVFVPFTLLLLTSDFVLAVTSVRSPRNLLIFIVKTCEYRVRVSRQHSNEFRKRSH